MKKIFCLMLALTMMTPSFLWAEEIVETDEVFAIVAEDEMLPPMPPAPVLPPAPEMGKPGGMPFICPMMGMPSMVATQDGGVVVLAGDQLQKFDADLNLVKEAKIQKPVPPMMKKKMGKTEKPEAIAPTPVMPPPAAEAVPVEEVDVVEGELDFQPV